MSVARVNLLPPEIGQRSARRRVIGVASSLLALYAVLLLALYVVKAGQVAEARGERDAALAELAVLQARETELAPFGALDAELDDRNAVLVSAMTPEVSGARVLNELSLAFPANSSLRTLTLAIAPPVVAAPVAAVPVAPAAPAEGPAPPAEGAAPPAEGAAPLPATPPVVAPLVALLPDPAVAEQTVIGAVTYDGYSVDRYAPGVETLLVDLDEVPGFTDPFALTAQVELIGETEVTGFGGDVNLTAEAYTRRYERGLTLETLR